MSLFRRVFSRAKGVDPFYADIAPEQVELYQRCFVKVVAAIDVGTQTKWSQGQKYNQEQFQRDTNTMKEIIDQEAASAGVDPALLRVMVSQFFFADVTERERDRDRWVHRVIHRNAVDYFLDGSAAGRVLEKIT